MNPTWADVWLLAPELNATGSYFNGNTAAQNALLSAIALRVSETVWGAKYALAFCTLARHDATLLIRAQTNIAGPVISEAVGSISRQYGNNSPAGTDPLYSSTPYGRQWLALLRGLDARIGFVA